MPEMTRLRITIFLLCALTGFQSVYAQNSNTNLDAKKNDIPGTASTALSSRETPGDNAGSNKTTLKFVDADIESVVAAFGDYTNTSFIIDPRVKGKINLVYDKPLSKAQAFQLLASVLRMQGYAMAPGNGYIKIVPEADAKLQTAASQAGTAHGDQIATQVFHLNFVSADKLVTVLRPLISPNNTINADPGNNTLVITDYADNLVRIGKIISSLDESAGNDLDVVPVHYAVASDIAAMVNRLLEPGKTVTDDAGRTTVLAYPRTNSVLVRASSRARVDLAKTLIEKLDQPTAQPGNVHVVYLRNAEATQLAQTLRAVVTADSSAISQTSTSRFSSPNSSPFSGQSNSSGQAPLSGQSTLPVQPPLSGQPPLTGASPLSGQSSSTGQLTQASSGVGGGFIQADATTNTLIITASESVYRDLRTVIDQLDARRAQVYIEALIVEVDANNSAELGAQWAGLAGNRSGTQVGGITGFTTPGGGNNLISQVAAKSAAIPPLAPGNGLTLGILNQSGIGTLIHLLATDTSANILSMPNILTLDNEEAKIIVGQNVPFITGQYTTAASAGAAGVNPFQTVDRQDIGLTLRVKPQISQGGTVKLAIYQETSAITDTTNPAGLITSKRSLDTNVLVDDGQIIVLGGLIDDNVQDNVEKVPGLSNLPLIGHLFQYKTRSRVKTNLMVFLRPTIIRSVEQNDNLAADRYGFIRNEEVRELPEHSNLLPNLNRPQLEPLKDGRLSGSKLYNRIDNIPLLHSTAPNAPASTQPISPSVAAPQQ